MAELSPDLYEKIVAHTTAGDALAVKEALDAALEEYKQAWNLVPDPKSDWKASTWILVAIGDACFRGGYFESGSEALTYALHCPDGFGNPFLHLRLGQIEFERGNLTASVEHLTRAYALEGTNIFNEDDPKYFEFLKTKIQPPVSGVW